MYQILNSAHSGMRWLVLITIVVAMILGFMNASDNSPNRKNGMALVALIMTHIQFLIGLGLFFISPKVSFESGMMKSSLLRFFTVEHTLAMLLGIIAITVGYSMAKRKSTFGQANKTVGIYYLIGLLIFLAMIPWPFREGLGGGWF